MGNENEKPQRTWVAFSDFINDPAGELWDAAKYWGIRAFQEPGRMLEDIPRFFTGEEPASVPGYLLKQGGRGVEAAGAYLGHGALGALDEAGGYLTPEGRVEFDPSRAPSQKPPTPTTPTPTPPTPATLPPPPTPSMSPSIADAATPPPTEDQTPVSQGGSLSIPGGDIREGTYWDPSRQNFLGQEPGGGTPRREDPSVWDRISQVLADPRTGRLASDINRAVQRPDSSRPYAQMGFDKQTQEIQAREDMQNELATKMYEMEQNRQLKEAEIASREGLSREEMASRERIAQTQAAGTPMTPEQAQAMGLPPELAGLSARDAVAYLQQRRLQEYQQTTAMQNYLDTLRLSAKDQKEYEASLMDTFLKNKDALYTASPEERAAIQKWFRARGLDIPDPPPEAAATAGPKRSLIDRLLQMIGLSGGQEPGASPGTIDDPNVGKLPEQAQALFGQARMKFLPHDPEGFKRAVAQIIEQTDPKKHDLAQIQRILSPYAAGSK